MFWKSLSAEQWSASATVLSAVVAVLNLAVVIILVGYNKATINILKAQSVDTRAQAAVALQTLSELNREKQSQRGRERMRTYGRLLDLNDRFVVLIGEVDRPQFSAAQHNFLKPDDWHEISEIVCEACPEATKRTLDLDQLLRRIDIDISLLRLNREDEQMASGTAHLKELLLEARPLLTGIAKDLVRFVAWA